MCEIPDLEEIEDAVRQLEVLPFALWPQALREEFDALAVEAARLLLLLHDRGLIRFTRTADGAIGAEVLERVRH
jgi:hypothetical protein